MTSLLLGSYRPGTSLPHRLGAGTKLAAVFVIGAIVMVVRGPSSALGFLVAAVLLVVWVGAGMRTTLKALRGILVIALALGVWQVWQHGWARAIESVADLVALVLVATVLTVTTPIDEMLDAIVRGLRPFRRVGVNPEAVALAFSLMLRSVPLTIDLANQSRDAARARGLERSPRARLTPVAIRVVAHAQATGDALHARGIGDD